MFSQGHTGGHGRRGRRCATALAGCGGGDSGGVAPSRRPSSVRAGRRRARRSSTTRACRLRAEQSCATCHVPSRAFTADPATDQGLPVPLGGPNMDLPGFRNAPSLMYARLTPAFFLDDGTPTGGFFRDGRASLARGAGAAALRHAVRDGQPGCRRGGQPPADLAGHPANRSWPRTARRCSPIRRRRSPTWARALPPTRPRTPEFHPFTSKFDSWLAGEGAADRSGVERARAVQQSRQGQLHRLSSEPARRATASIRCSPISPTTTSVCRATGTLPANSSDPISPISGVPLDLHAASRANVPADAEYTYYDLGLCGPFAAGRNDPEPRADVPR